MRNTHRLASTDAPRWQRHPHSQHELIHLVAVARRFVDGHLGAVTQQKRAQPRAGHPGTTQEASQRRKRRRREFGQASGATPRDPSSPSKSGAARRHYFRDPVLWCPVRVFIFAPFVSSLLSRSRFPRCPARVLPVVLFAFSLLSRFAFPCCPVRVCLSTLSVGLETSLARWCPPTVDGINLVAPSPPKRLQFLLCASISESHPAPLPPNFKVVSQSSARLWDRATI